MINYIYIALGGILGACSRHFIFALMATKSLNFPHSTIFVNVLGCLLIGVISEFFALRSHLPYHIRLFLVTGFLGSFTTFSTFVVDIGILFDKHEFLKSFMYIILSITLGIMSFFAAIYVVRYFLSPKII